jgi:hypothetical protein
MLIKTKALTKWLLRMWPVLLPISFALIHYLISVNFPVHLPYQNKCISLFLQIIGGIIVLYSIDSNLGIIGNSSLLSLFSSYMKSFPLIKRSYDIKTGSGSIKITGHSAKLRVGNSTNTIEGKLIYLQQQIDWLKEDLRDEAKELKGMITNEKKQTDIKIGEIERSIGSVDKKITESSFGSIKIQIFDVLLMIHGSISSYYS